MKRNADRGGVLNNKRGSRVESPGVFFTIAAYGVGMTAFTWFEYVLSVPVLLTAVVT